MIYADLQHYKVMMFIFISQKTTYEIVQTINKCIEHISSPQDYKLIIISKNVFPESCLGEKGTKFHAIEFYSQTQFGTMRDVDIEYHIFSD
jgi:hypothetical protein